jgi:hypothetical protein
LFSFLKCRIKKLWLSEKKMALRIIPLEDVFVAALNVAQVYSILLVYRMFLPGQAKLTRTGKKERKEALVCDLQSF